MINRRHIRVKVMQSIYAMQHAHTDDLVREEKFIKHSIQKLFDLYVLNLQLLIEVQKLARKKIELSKKKILATQEDLQPNTKFVNNRLLKTIAESVSLESYVTLNKLNHWEVNDEYVKHVLKQLQDSPLYLDYLKTPSTSGSDDRDVIVSFFRDIIAPDEKLAEYYEDTVISWVDDIPFVNTWVLKTLKQQSLKKPLILGSLYKDDDDKQFVTDLFIKTMLHQHTYDDDIQSKTPNWEVDRIADIDMVLIKMALTEFLHFPSIPLRVTINEYIELSKDYSTQKSGTFINGVLDKLSKDYLESGKIVKIGRGLL